MSVDGFTDRKDGKPKYRPGQKYALLVREVNAVMAQYDMPLTLRQIYYRLVAKQIIPNFVNEYKSLSHILVKARERGDVNWRRIEDRLRSTLGGDIGYDDDADFEKYNLKQLKEAYKKFGVNMWSDQPYYVEVWVEKDALSRLVSDAAGEYNVMTCPSRGYSSFTFLAQAVVRIYRQQQNDKDALILYFGDYDPSGKDIVRDLKERLIRYGVSSDLEVVPVALNMDQIEKYKLPPAPVKKTDSRAEAFIATHGDVSVELDAIEPDILQDMISQAIWEYIDEGPWAARKEQEEKWTAQLKDWCKTIQALTPYELEMIKSDYGSLPWREMWNPEGVEP